MVLQPSGRFKCDIVMLHRCWRIVILGRGDLLCLACFRCCFRPIYFCYPQPYNPRDSSSRLENPRTLCPSSESRSQDALCQRARVTKIETSASFQCSFLILARVQYDKYGSSRDDSVLCTIGYLLWSMPYVVTFQYKL